MAKAPIGNRKLFVGGVPQDMHQTDLYSIFSEYGKVKKAWVQKCKHVSTDNEVVQNHRGFGFVIFVDESTIEQLLGGNFSRFIMLPNGRKLEIKLALSSNKIASDPSLLTQGNQGRVSKRVLHVATGGAAAAVAASAAAAAAVAAAKTVAVHQPPSFGVPVQPQPPMPSLLMEPVKVRPSSFSDPPSFSDLSLYPSDVAALPRLSPPGLAWPTAWTQKGTSSTIEELMAGIASSTPMMPLINAWGNKDVAPESARFVNKL